MDFESELNKAFEEAFKDAKHYRNYNGSNYIGNYIQYFLGFKACFEAK